MKVFYNPKFKQWQAESEDRKTAAWGDTKEEAIKRLKDVNNDEQEA